MTLARAMLILRFISVAELDNEKEGAGILSKWVVIPPISKTLLCCQYITINIIINIIDPTLAEYYPRQFFSLAADLEKTRQALLIATVSSFLFLVQTFTNFQWLKRKMGTSVDCQKRWDMFTVWP